MLETLIFAAFLCVGIVLLAVVMLKTVILFFEVGFWALALPLKIFFSVLAALFSLLFAVVAPILLVVGFLGLAVTLPIVVIFALPCLLIGFGICLILSLFS